MYHKRFLKYVHVRDISSMYMRLKYTQKSTCPLATTIYTLLKTQTRNQNTTFYLIQCRHGRCVHVSWCVMPQCRHGRCVHVSTTRWAMTSCRLECSNKRHTYHTSSRVSICVCPCMYMRMYMCIYIRMPIDLELHSTFHWQEAHIRHRKHRPAIKETAHALIKPA